jgi:hypothetical protein
MRLKEVVRFLAPPLARQPHHIDQHFREGVAGHRAIDSALHLEIEAEAAVARENRDTAQLVFLLESPDRSMEFALARMGPAVIGDSVVLASEG